VVWIAALPTQASQRSVASAIKPNATSTANSGIASRPQEFDEVLDEEPVEGLGAGGNGFGGGAVDGAAAADEDPADAIELADDDGPVCSC
jgi:hypothetical protein